MGASVRTMCVGFKKVGDAVGVGDEAIVSMGILAGTGRSRNENLGHGFGSGVNGFSGTSLVLVNIGPTQSAEEMSCNVLKGLNTFSGTTAWSVVSAVWNEVPAVTVVTGTTRRIFSGLNDGESYCG